MTGMRALASRAEKVLCAVLETIECSWSRGGRWCRTVMKQATAHCRRVENSRLNLCSITHSWGSLIKISTRGCFSDRSCLIFTETYIKAVEELDEISFWNYALTASKNLRMARSIAESRARLLIVAVILAVVKFLREITVTPYKISSILANNWFTTEST